MYAHKFIAEIFHFHDQYSIKKDRHLSQSFLSDLKLDHRIIMHVQVIPLQRVKFYLQRIQGMHHHR